MKNISANFNKLINLLKFTIVYGIDVILLQMIV